MSTVGCDIVTPIRSLYQTKDAYMVVIPGAAGEMGFLEGHEPAVALLANGGVVRIHNSQDNDSDITKFVISGGYIAATGEKVIVLADRAQAVDEIDAKVVKEELEGYQAELAQTPEDDRQHEILTSRIAWCEARLNVVSA